MLVPPVRPAPQPDALSNLLASVRLSGAIFFMMEVSRPWDAACVPHGRELARELAPGTRNLISFHVVTEGECWAGVYGSPPQRLGVGDVVVFPRGDPYYLAQTSREPDAPVLANSFGMLGAQARMELPFCTRFGGGGERTGMICGFLGCDDGPFNPLLDALPAMMVVRQERDPELGERLRNLVSLTLAESRAPTPGAALVRTRLSELLFVELVRRYLASLPADQSGWLAGLRDEVVGRALAALHQRPAEPWSLHTLAREAGASRSVLAERFHSLVGLPPMRYLARWRLQLAAQRLAQGRAKVSAVALEVGYESEAAFTRAFKKLTGVAPGAWKKTAQA